MPSLNATSDLLRLLGDSTRVRLLALLAGEELTVAELTGALRVAQSRVSSHLGRLREAGLLRPRRHGASTYYALNGQGMPEPARRLWSQVAEGLDDHVLEDDRQRVRALLKARSGTWAESVAGQMERHYSPGRTWEAAVHALIGLATLGDVLDIASGDGALAELVAPHARSVTCIDISDKVVRAGRARLARLGSVRFSSGDMHALPLPDAVFDQVLFLNALSYSRDPGRAVAEAARVLRPGGTLVATALKAHKHADLAAGYDHVRTGFQLPAFRKLFESAGLRTSFCAITSRERRAPHFEVLTLYAQAGRPAKARTRRVRRSNGRSR